MERLSHTGYLPFLLVLETLELTNLVEAEGKRPTKTVHGKSCLVCFFFQNQSDVQNVFGSLAEIQIGRGW